MISPAGASAGHGRPVPGGPHSAMALDICAAGAPAVVWSDAHRPAEVAHGDEPIPWARERDLRLVGAGHLGLALAR